MVHIIHLQSYGLSSLPLTLSAKPKESKAVSPFNGDPVDKQPKPATWLFLMKFLLGLVTMVLVCAVGSRSLAATDKKWEFLYSENGIEIFTGAGAEVPTFKAEGVIPINLVDLLAVISDVPRRREWLPDITLSRILEGDIQSRVVIYERIDMPWPLRNRDCVVESVIEKDYDRGEVIVNYRQIDHPEMPPVPGYVRMPVVRGQMRYRFIDASHTAALYETTLDIGGSLPQWMVTLGVKKVPAYSLNAIIKQVGLTQGRYREFVETQQAKLKFKY